jgi:hypothetical protein
MNDPVIERIAREDPAMSSRSDTANELLARVLHEIDRAAPAAVRDPPRRSLGRVAAPAAAALVTLAVAVAAIGLVGHRPHASGSIARPAHPVKAIALRTVRVAPGTEALLADGGSLWVAGAHSLTRLSPMNGAVEMQIPLPTEGLADGVEVGAGSLWVASGGGNTGSAPSLARVDPANGRMLAAIDVTGGGGRGLRVLNGGIAFAAGRIWLSRDTTASRGDVVSVDPATNRLDGRPVAVGTGPTTLLAAFGFLWVDNTGLTVGVKPSPVLPASVSRIDPRTRQVETESFVGAPSAGFGSVWVRDDNAVTRFNPATGRVIARIHVPGVVAVAFGAGRVWAVSQSANRSDPNGSTATLIQIDPRSNRTVGAPSHLQTSQPIAIAVSGGDLWIADYHGGLLHFKLTHP